MKNAGDNPPRSWASQFLKLVVQATVRRAVLRKRGGGLGAVRTLDQFLVVATTTGFPKFKPPALETSDHMDLPPNAAGSVEARVSALSLPSDVRPAAPATFREKFEVASQQTPFNHPSFSAKFLLVCVRLDLPLPFQFLVAEPHILFVGGSMVVMVPGPRTGMTLLGNQDGRIQGDVDRKVDRFHLNFYMKAVVMNPANISTSRNVFLKKYVQGMGAAFYDPLSTNDMENYANGTNPDDYNLFCMVVPPEWRPTRTVMDVCGFFDPSLVTRDQTPHYPTAQHYARHWGFRHRGGYRPGMPRPPGQLDNMYNCNTVMAQGAQWGWDHGAKDYCAFTRNTGHLGPGVGPGMAEAFHHIGQMFFPDANTLTRGCSARTFHRAVL